MMNINVDQWHIQDLFNGGVLKFNRLMASGRLCPLLYYINKHHVFI
jgi:hypothetical protein